jgi:hypothetical protein
VNIPWTTVSFYALSLILDRMVDIYLMYSHCLEGFLSSCSWEILRSL